MRGRWVQRKTRLSTTGVALVVVAIVGSSCNSGGQASRSTRGISHLGSPDQIKAKIRLAEKANSGMGRKRFCRAMWSGPQVHQQLAARLAVNRPSLVAGRRMFAVIENLGMASLAYGVTPSVDHLVGGEWHPRQLRRNGQRVLFPTISLELKPRTRSTCIEVPISASWQPGLYRVWFPVARWGGKASEPVLWPMSYFRVVFKPRKMKQR
jgi:hypothetical protein